jgi:plastocyanin
MVYRVRFLMIGAVASVALAAVGSSAGVDAGGGCHALEDVKATDTAGVTVEIGNCSFGPTVLRIEPGEQVTWMNASEAPHTVTGLTGNWGDTRELLNGASVGYSFESAGTYPYSCVLHSGMVGAVVVGDGVSDNVLTGAAVRAAPGAGPGPDDGGTATADVGAGDEDGMGRPRPEWPRAWLASPAELSRRRSC